ncbi:guanylate kinase, partial [Rhodospirillales bacterium]|nr:guanylate kinase [Rhodospirillales bacterium]
RRLYTRGQDPEDVVKKRMAKATSEMSHWAEYDYIIINEAIEHSVREAEAILSAERLKLMRRVGMSEWLRGMGVGQ